VARLVNISIFKCLFQPVEGPLLIANRHIGFCQNHREVPLMRGHKMLQFIGPLSHRTLVAGDDESVMDTRCGFGKTSRGYGFLQFLRGFSVHALGRVTAMEFVVEDGIVRTTLEQGSEGLNRTVVLACPIQRVHELIVVGVELLGNLALFQSFILAAHNE
jgi:hypothetical protein